MSESMISVGRLGAHDIGKKVNLQHGDSLIRGVLRNIVHDVETLNFPNVAGESTTEYEVTTTLDIDGVIVYGLRPTTPIITDL